ncbi:MAG: hypothetical protein ABR552_06025 [Actinomycetota bacterium]
MRRPLLLLVALTMLVPPAARALPVTAQDTRVDPVILTGAHFPTWSAGPDPTFREPQAPGNPKTLGGGIPPDPLGQSDCHNTSGDHEDPSTDHSCYQSSRIPHNPREGVPVGRLLGYRWDADAQGGEGQFVQIPFQVDERFTRYLSNNASDFGAFSGVDQHNTYAFDREGWRFTDDDGVNVCTPIPRQDPPGSGMRPATTPDPVKGLDDDDEVVFMARDAGPRAPAGSALPDGIDSAYTVPVLDVSTGTTTYAYVMLAKPDGPAPEFTAQNSPYVRYTPDPNARSVFVYSESSYENYGAAPKGPYCLPNDATVRDTSHGQIAQRRELDTAWIYTPHYAFRYDGHWLMTQLRVAQSDLAGPGTSPGQYGPDLIDRWKARAFAQDPSSDTPCCGYEEEDTNWGGSSILMGERAGPVRVIRETWGADSSTNNARREIFYRDTFVWGDALRVHPIPPLDGIYSQWDYNAGVITKYYNPSLPNGVAVDGKNDEAFGNLDDPCNARYPSDGSPIDDTYRSTYAASHICDFSPYHQSVDVTDPTFSGAEQLQWEESTGPYGGMVTRTMIRDHTPGGDAQSMLAVPYYRDDSCFDDGTGTDPGPKLNLRSGDEPATWGYNASNVPVSPAPAGSEVHQRVCWAPGDPVDPNFSPQGDIRYLQGDIGAHGVHVMVIAESDNAYQTVPLTELDSEQRVIVLGPTLDNVGDRYGRYVEEPLVAHALPYA